MSRLFVGACTSSALQPDGGRDTVGTGQGGDGGGAPDASDAGPPGLVGRVLVVQQGVAAAPDLWTRAWFAQTSACVAQQFGGTVCSCTDTTIGSCVTRSCTGRGGYYFGQSPWLLGYAAGAPLATAGGPLAAGTLDVTDGAHSFAHATDATANLDVHDVLSAPWQTADAVRISASGETVPAFSVDVPFPPRVTFLEPDFSAGTVVLDADALDVKWTPVDAPGSVEVTVSSGFQPDAGYNFTVVRCSSPVGAGQMHVPVTGPSVQGPGGWVSLAFRVLNRGTVQIAGLTVDAIVASFDSGPIDQAPPSSDAGATN